MYDSLKYHFEFELDITQPQNLVHGIKTAQTFLSSTFTISVAYMGSQQFPNSIPFSSLRL